MTGPFTRKGSVGNCPLSGPGSVLFSGKLRLHEGDDRVVQALSKRQPQREHRSALERELPRERDIPVRGAVELPLHLKAVGQISPAVAPTHVAAGGAAERHVRSKREPGVLLFGGENGAAGDLDDVGVIAPASAGEMGRAERVERSRDNRSDSPSRVVCWRMQGECGSEMISFTIA